MEPPFQDMLIPKNLLDLVQPDPTFEAGKHACSKLQAQLTYIVFDWLTVRRLKVVKVLTT